MARERGPENGVMASEPTVETPAETAVTAHSRAHRVSTTRTLRRTEHEVLPFMPYGLVPLLGLLALLLYAIFPFARNVIERTAQTTAESALERANADWAELDVSGQWVTLRGAPPTQAQADAAVDAVRRARAPALFGEARPVTRVRAEFAPVGTPPAPDAEPLPPPDRVAPSPATRSPDWAFRRTRDTLRLEGEVAGEGVRRALLADARNLLDPPRLTTVQDAMVIADVSDSSDQLSVARRGIRLVSRCDAGVARFQDEVFSLRCELPASQAAEVEGLARMPLPVGQIGLVDMITDEAVRACEQELRSLLSGAKIEFATSSAEIEPTSADLLDRVAEAARDCPGVLRVEGHTDSTGSADLNETLSRARARAVRSALIERGVDPARLIAQGYGARVPIASNATPEGRARNRRIEINVMRDGE